MISLLYKIVYFFYIKYSSIFKRFLKLFVVVICFWTLYTIMRSTMINEIMDYAKVIQTVAVIEKEGVPEELEDKYVHLTNMIRDIDTPLYNTYSSIRKMFVMNEEGEKINYEIGYVGVGYKQGYFKTGFKYSFLIHCIVYGSIFIVGYLFMPINGEDDEEDGVSIIVGVLYFILTVLLLFLVSIIISIIFPFCIISWRLTQVIIVVCNLMIDISSEVLLLKKFFGTKTFKDSKEELLSNLNKENF